MRLPPARCTHLIAIAMVASYVLLAVTGLNDAASFHAGFVPGRLSGLEVVPALPVWLTPLAATLLHGSVLHLGFNLLMLIFCGRMVEAVVGPVRLAILFVIGAYAAAGAEYLANPYSGSAMIGASGAISVVFGAYALLFGRPRGFADHPRIGRAVNILWLAAAWIGVQLLMGYAFAGLGMAIAIWAHVGGFLAGLVVLKPLMTAGPQRTLNS